MKMVISFRNKIAEKIFRDATAVLPICKYLEDVVKDHHPEQSTLPFLINKPSCTRYFTNWYIVTNEHQKRFINELKNKKPRLILYWSKLDVYNFDDYKRFPLVNTYLKNNYKTYNKNENWHFLERK